MRPGLIVIALLLLSACTALVVGGGSGGGRQEAEREASVIASDAAITSRIKASYDADSSVRTFNISIRSYKGVVTLSGTVSSHVPRERAGRIAKATDGVVAVNNLLVVAAE